MFGLDIAAFRSSQKQVLLPLNQIKKQNYQVPRHIKISRAQES